MASENQNPKTVVLKFGGSSIGTPDAMRGVLEIIRQTKEEFIHNLQNEGGGYALYTMGFPAILPSAVYLYHTHGEAQHHSSRTIEELFDHIGYQARETNDFDPTGFPSDQVVELWEILTM